MTVEYLDYTNGDDQVNTAIEGGQAPDLIMEGPERLVANWGAKGLMVDLSDILDDTDKSEIYESVLSACVNKEASSECTSNSIIRKLESFFFCVHS